MDPLVDQALARSFLQAQPPDTLRRLLGASRVHEVSATRVFIKEAERHRCGVLLSGLARVYVLRPDGEQLTVQRAEPGDAIGIHALPQPTNDANAQAITDCEFLLLDAGLLIEMGRTSAALAWAIAEELDRRLMDRHLERMRRTRGSVRQKVAAALLDRSVEGTPLEVTLTQEQLAEVIGASREAVGRELRRLSLAGLVTLRRGAIFLLDARGLHAVAVEAVPSEQL